MRKLKYSCFNGSGSKISTYLSIILQEFNRDAILQQFDISIEEKLLSVLLKSFPFYWHEKLEEQTARSAEQTDDQGTSRSRISAFDIQLTSHTVLDGCMIVTDSTVYECRPRLVWFVERCLKNCTFKYEKPVASPVFWMRL